MKAELFHAAGRTYRHDKLIVSFGHFANVPKNANRNFKYKNNMQIFFFGNKLASYSVANIWAFNYVLRLIYRPPTR
jgi:hypothetical protein